MGGFAALALAMKHVDLFGSVVAYAPALLEVQRAADGTETIARAGGTHAGGSPYSPALAAKNRQVFITMFGDDAEVFDRHSPWALVRSHATTLRDALPLRIVIGTDWIVEREPATPRVVAENGYDHERRTIDSRGRPDVLYEEVGVDGIAWHARFKGWRTIVGNREHASLPVGVEDRLAFLAAHRAEAGHAAEIVYTVHRYGTLDSYCQGCRRGNRGATASLDGAFERSNLDARRPDSPAR